MTTWADRFMGVPYKWPEYYCGAMAHAAILADTGRRSLYPVLAARATSEAHMIQSARLHQGSVTAAHVVVMSEVGARIVPAHEAKACWCDNGYVHAIDGGQSHLLSDARGVLLIRAPRPDRRWLMWTQAGLVYAHEPRWSAKIAWTWDDTPNSQSSGRDRVYSQSSYEGVRDMMREAS